MKTATSRSALVSKPRRPVSRVLMILFCVVLFAGVYMHYHPQHTAGRSITYHIDQLDERFSLSRGEVSDALREAASIWEKAANQQLFREDEKGEIAVSFVYDSRQEAADKLKSLSGTISNTKESYEFWKVRFEALQSDFARNKATFANDINDYSAKMNALNAAFAEGTKKGGVSKDVYRHLMEEKDALDSIREDIERRQAGLNGTAEDMNRMALVINEIATNLNLDVVNYNNTGRQLANEFSEGCYEMKKGRQTITIYHFLDRTRLVRLLTHELGHALGIQHNNNPEAIMYRLNRTDSLNLAPEDVSALQEQLQRKKSPF